MEFWIAFMERMRCFVLQKPISVTSCSLVSCHCHSRYQRSQSSARRWIWKSRNRKTIISLLSRRVICFLTSPFLGLFNVEIKASFHPCGTQTSHKCTCDWSGASVVAMKRRYIDVHIMTYALLSWPSDLCEFIWWDPSPYSSFECVSCPQGVGVLTVLSYDLRYKLHVVIGLHTSCAFGPHVHNMLLRDLLNRLTIGIWITCTEASYIPVCACKHCHREYD